MNKQTALANTEKTDQSKFRDLAKHFGKVVNYPKKAKEERTVGKVATSFKIVEGKISDIQVLHSLSDELDKEVLRCLKSYTEKIDVPDDTYTLVVAFELQKTGSKEKSILNAPAIDIQNLPNVLSEVTVVAYYK